MPSKRARPQIDVHDPHGGESAAPQMVDGSASVTLSEYEALQEQINSLTAEKVENAHVRHDLDLALAARDEALKRAAEVLRHNTELVEEKRLMAQRMREMTESHDITVGILGKKLQALHVPHAAQAHPPSDVPHLLHWAVRQADDEKKLEALLNALSGDGWTIDQICEPRGGAYRVIARKGRQA